MQPVPARVDRVILDESPDRNILVELSEVLEDREVRPIEVVFENLDQVGRFLEPLGDPSLASPASRRALGEAVSFPDRVELPDRQSGETISTLPTYGRGPGRLSQKSERWRGGDRGTQRFGSIGIGAGPSRAIGLHLSRGHRVQFGCGSSWDVEQIWRSRDGD